jgi:hypothetical protein
MISDFCWYRLHLPVYYFFHDVVKHVHGSTVSKKNCALKETYLSLLLIIQKIEGYPKHMAVQHVIRYISTGSYRHYILYFLDTCLAGFLSART